MTLALAALALVAAACDDISPGGGDATPTPSPADAVAGVAPSGVAEIAAKVAPAVARVGVNCVTVPQGGEQCAGAGSAWLFDSSGHFVTNSHVVTLEGAIEEPADLKLTLSDGREVRAEVVGHDPRTDLAVLAADIDGLEPLPLGDSRTARIGDPVIAIGYALDLGVSPSVTTGVISAKERQIMETTASIYGLIQTDAAINPGNSGGPLLDYSGRVLGVNTATALGSEGVGFAVAVRTVEAVAREIIRNGSVERGFMGITFTEVTPGLAEQEGLSVDNGVLIQQVQANSPADRAGLRPGDVIVKLGGEDIELASDVPLALIGAGPGSALEVTVNRDGQEVTLTVTLGQPPSIG